MKIFLATKLPTGRLCLFDFAGFDRLGAYPHALDLTAGKFHPNPLQIRSKSTLVHFDKLQANTSGFLALAFVYDATALAGSLSGDGAYFGHDVFLGLKKEKNDAVGSWEGKLFQGSRKVPGRTAQRAWNASPMRAG